MDNVPVLTLSLGGQELSLERVEAARNNSISMHVDQDANKPRIKRKTKKEEALEYFNKFDIPDKMNALVTQLLLNKPDSPMSFCIQYMRTQGSQADGEPAAASGPADQALKAKLGDPASREYLLRHKLPWMFDDLLANILLEKPDDPLGFCLTWIRWNCSKYCEDDTTNATLGIRMGYSEYDDDA
jgi:hypothetical protein